MHKARIALDEDVFRVIAAASSDNDSMNSQVESELVFVRVN
jgi:hypothetical protein